MDIQGTIDLHNDTAVSVSTCMRICIYKNLCFVLQNRGIGT